MIVLPMSAGTLTLGGGTGNLTINGSDISSLNYLVMSSSTFNLQDNCTITNGNVLYSAVYIGGGTFKMTGGEIKNNKATQSSYSGIYVLGNINIEGGSICDNYVGETNNGASIYNQKSDEITVLDQTISANGGHFTKNIIEGKVEEVATGGGGTTTSYSIGDVYYKNNTPMGVVFEVAEDNRYIKIVALDQSDNVLKFDDGWLETSDTKNFSDEDDGLQNHRGLETVIENYLKEYDNCSISGFPAAEFCYNYYVPSSDELWYLPAIGELISIMQTNFEQINKAIQSVDGTKIFDNSEYWSSTMIENTEDVYYCTNTTPGRQYQNMNSSCWVRPITTITLSE